MTAIERMLGVAVLAVAVAFCTGLVTVLLLVVTVMRTVIFSPDALILVAAYLFTSNVAGWIALFTAVVLAEIMRWRISSTIWLFPLALSVGVLWWFAKALYWPDPVPPENPYNFTVERIHGTAAAIVMIVGPVAAIAFQHLRAAMNTTRGKPSPRPTNRTGQKWGGD